MSSYTRCSSLCTCCYAGPLINSMRNGDHSIVLRLSYKTNSDRSWKGSLETKERLGKSDWSSLLDSCSCVFYSQSLSNLHTQAALRSPSGEIVVIRLVGWLVRWEPFRGIYCDGYAGWIFDIKPIALLMVILHYREKKGKERVSFDQFHDLIQCL